MPEPTPLRHRHPETCLLAGRDGCVESYQILALLLPVDEKFPLRGMQAKSKRAGRNWIQCSFSELVEQSESALACR